MLRCESVDAITLRTALERTLAALPARAFADPGWTQTCGAARRPNHD